jgi:hypothetical protein
VTCVHGFSSAARSAAMRLRANGPRLQGCCLGDSGTPSGSYMMGSAPGRRPNRRAGALRGEARWAMPADVERLPIVMCPECAREVDDA